ncbi:type I-E CRISPR-associated protein Cse2/CasB [Streptomyces albus]|uniref:type I-E CRISPR-associated protein Cse2/CasB n=1 Tax=Streptomyces albus TaxID=1888 RepID=UPI003F19F409
MTASAASTTPSRRGLEVIGELVLAEVSRLQEGYRRDRSAAVSSLARLRRGAGRAPMSTPDLWGLIDLAPLHDADSIRGEEAMEHAQNAVFATLALYALHQQSRSDGMHTNSRAGELGRAVRRLMPAGQLDEPIRKRFVRTGAATDFVTLTVRLRELVSLLRRDGIPLDYALLAEQLYRWQRPGGREAVRRSWGLSFHAAQPRTGDGDSTDSSQNPPEDNAQ